MTLGSDPLEIGRFRECDFTSRRPFTCARYVVGYDSDHGYASDEFEEGRNILYLISATEDLVPDPAPFDHSRAAAFEERLVGVLNAGALCLMTSLGHRVGLFDAMADMPAAGSEAIAARCGLNERYVREWLGAMVASGVVDYDPRDGTYALPSEHAAFLTRTATPANLAVYAQYIPLLGAVEDDVLACFRAGGGVPYARFERFHEVMAEDSGQTVLPVLKSAASRWPR